MRLLSVLKRKITYNRRYLIAFIVGRTYKSRVGFLWKMIQKYRISLIYCFLDE